MILHERFQPLWSRCRFLLEVDERRLATLAAAAEELLAFVEALEMGDFYTRRLRDLVARPPQPRVWSTDTPSDRFDQWEREATAEYRDLLKRNRAPALALIVEMLRYQNWPVKSRDTS